MHTFFINTSGKELENYADIFEMQHETKRLVSLSCPLADWNEKETGYRACAGRMGELIDNYKEINNDFNLIVYIDLLTYKQYTSISMSNHRERYACLKTLRAILKHYIEATLLRELDENGRVPGEVLLIFEENELPKDADENSPDGKNLIRSYASSFLGLPDEETLDSILKSRDDGGKCGITVDCFCASVAEHKLSAIADNALDAYKNEVDIFICEAKEYGTVAEPLERLLDRVVALSRTDDKNTPSVSFVTNRRAGISNKQEKTRRNLRLCFYILQCVEEETVYNIKSRGKDELTVKEFPEIEWDEVVASLSAKGKIFHKKHKDTMRLAESFTELKLAPPLYSFDNYRFALDEYGKKATNLEVVTAEEKKDGEQEEKDIEEGKIRVKGAKELVETDVERSPLFDNEEYPLFDYSGDKFDERVLNKNASIETYIAEAKKLRRHHLDYLERLKVHVSDRLSNYAGRSDENDPALLGKRKVSVGDEDFEDAGKAYRYAKPGRSVETRKLKTVDTISKTAYTTTLFDYMEFCAGRSVAMTDIEEQCNWFITRAHQIETSLKKLRTVAFGLLFALLALYIPYLALGWKGITANVLSVTTALVSIAIPIALLYIIFMISSVIQRRKLRYAWNEFKEKSDLILQENAVAAKKYDELLTVYIPTLRWVYEYRLDVEFYSDCCKMAKAKVAHHLSKLHDRIVTIGNIIEDLEANEPDPAEVAKKEKENKNDEIDYNVSFCTGSKNRRFYSVIDTYFLKTAHK